KCQPTFPISVNLHLSDKDMDYPSQERLSVIAKNTTALWNDRQETRQAAAFFPIHVSTASQKWTGSTEQDIVGKDESTLERLLLKDRPSMNPGTYDFFIAPGDSTVARVKSQRQGYIQVDQWDDSHIINTVADTLDAIFGSEKESIVETLSTDQEVKERDEDQLKAVKYAPEYQLTFSLLDGEADVREWNMRDVIQAYLSPFLKDLSIISKFTIESQVQHFASLPLDPQLDSIKNEHYLTPDQLPHFINSAEWSLASTVSSNPSLNFIAYVPKSSQSPLVIKSAPGETATTNAFLIPRWGGISVLNRESKQDIILGAELKPVLTTFLSQLRDLLGITDLAAASLGRGASARGELSVKFQKNTNGAPTAWELDNLLRRRTLVADTPNMVVLDHIYGDVIAALKDVALSCKNLGQQDYIGALIESRSALSRSETAFFDPTMVSMLYFPDEHKYAIYMPLFVPISVPLVMALLKEVKKLKQAKKAKAKVE
ncbi:hypothetical protein BGW38_007456, partial [Lunasporangiospora selenospora]